MQRTTNASLGVTLVLPNGKRFHAQCTEVSMRGAGMHMVPTRDPKLEVGDEVGLQFKAMSRSDSIRTQGRVISAKTTPSGMRYGFEFLEVGDIRAQLDSFYSRWFNRRRYVRVLPARAHELKAKLAIQGRELDVSVHDISIGGLGLLVPAEGSSAFEKAESLRVTMRLPCEAEDIQVIVRIRARTAVSNQVLLSVEFETNPDFAHCLPQLKRFIDRRLESVWQGNTVMSVIRQAR